MRREGTPTKQFVCALMKGLKLNVAKGHYWSDIYNGTKDGTSTDWGRIAHVAYEESKFFFGLSKHNYRLYFGLGSNVWPDKLRSDRLQMNVNCKLTVLSKKTELP